MKFKLFIALITLLSLPIFLFAGNGSLSGKVTDKNSKETLIGAIVMIDSNTTMSVATDFDGNYKIENITAGKHHIRVKYIGYTTQNTTVTITETQNTTLDFSLISASKDIKEVVLTEKRAKNTENSIVVELRKADAIVSGMSSAQIQRSQDRTAADAVKRIPGVTIQDGRFINIRGLNERYNNVWWNDAGAPSAEADKRAFSFDAIQTGMIDRIMIYKTPSAELPGDFAGGMVKIYSIDMPEKNSVIVNYSTSFRTGTVFKPLSFTAGSKTDLLGFDNGFRSVPSSTPPFISKNDPNISVITKSFRNNWGISKAMAIPDQRANLVLQGVKKFKGVKIGSTTAINYAFTQTNFVIYRADYDSTNQNTLLTDTQSTRQVQIGVMENIAVRFGTHELTFKTLLNQLGREQNTIRSNTFGGQNQLFYAEDYQARTNVLTQLGGTHRFNKDKTIYTWAGSYSYSNKNQPDLRRIQFAYNPADSLYKAQVANVVDPVNGGGRFSAKLREHIFSLNQNVKQKITIKDYNFEMNFGGYLEYKTRTFAARVLGYTIRPGQIAYNLTQLPLDQIFSPENVGGANQFRLDEITNLSDAYTAQNLNISPYVNFNLPIGKFVKIVAGLRYEYNKQSLQSYGNLDSSSHITPSIVTNFVLPSVNTSFSINEKNLIRVAYGETLNRPEFREWAPFYFYDFEFNAGNYGSLYPTSFYPSGMVLKVAKIQNVDLRYEWYPNAGDMVHVGGFFKYFQNPIQQIINSAGGSDSKSFTYINGDHAYTAGAELDVRKNLGFMGSKVMKDFTLVCNAAYIYSKLYMPQLPTVNPTSALQGQAPYIINTGLFYQNDSIGLKASLLYNVTGPRIYILGNAFYPNIGDMPVHNLDFSLSYTIIKKLTFTVSAQNLINTPNRLVLDIDRNGKFDTKHGLDKDYRKFYTGRIFSVGVSFRL